MAERVFRSFEEYIVAVTGRAPHTCDTCEHNHKCRIQHAVVGIVDCREWEESVESIVRGLAKKTLADLQERLRNSAAATGVASAKCINVNDGGCDDGTGNAGRYGSVRCDPSDRTMQKGA